MTVAAHDTKAGHRPEQRVEGTRLGTEEVPSRIVGRSSLRYLVFGTRFDGMNQVGELDSILNEEDGDVVSNDV